MTTLAEERELLLAEMDAIFNQVNARLGVIASIQNTSIVLAGVLATVFATLNAGNHSIPGTWSLFLSIPFYLLAFMLVREDRILAAGDARFYELRQQLLQPFQANQAGLLKYPPSIKGDELVPSYQRLTLLRYLVTALPPVGLVVGFILQAKVAFTPLGVFNALLVGGNLGVLMLLYRFLRTLSRISDEVDKRHFAAGAFHSPENKDTLPFGERTVKRSIKARASARRGKKYKNK